MVTRSVLSRATEVVSRRLDRRGFLARSAMAGRALVVAPGTFLLRPTSAYAAICNCSGSACGCGSLCCDGYTEFCCASTGINACPEGSIIGGWWKADGSSYCGGAARYYIDCHKPCGTCACGSSGVCSGACSGTPCGCGQGRCDHRKEGCTNFRYGNCNNDIACIGPIECRVVTCTKPWKLDASCSSTAMRTDNNTRDHNRPCLQEAPPIMPVVGSWGGPDSGIGIGFYDGRTGTWTLRGLHDEAPVATFTYGVQPGDIPVVGDWNNDGFDTVGIYRNGEWHLNNNLQAGTTFTTFTYGVKPGDIPVVGDWNNDGFDTVGIYRNGEWHLNNNLQAGTTFTTFTYGVKPGDIPVVGDWNNDGFDTVGIYRNGEWHLNNNFQAGTTFTTLSLGTEPGDIPVVGDWTGTGSASIGIYRPSEGRWYLRTSLDDPTLTEVTFGPAWTTG